MSAKKKQKQVSMEEYIETYCQEKRIRGRYAVYISPEAHETLKTIVGMFFREHHTTTSSLADSIILHHIETHRELLTEAHREDTREFYEWLKSKKKRMDEELDEPEEQPMDNCPDEKESESGGEDSDE
jgi:hypothetical protein